VTRYTTNFKPLIISNYLLVNNNQRRTKKMKVKIKKWHAVAVWKWEIDEDVRVICVERFQKSTHMSSFIKIVDHILPVNFIIKGLRYLSNALRGVLPWCEISRRRLPASLGWLWACLPYAMVSRTICYSSHINKHSSITHHYQGLNSTHHNHSHLRLSIFLHRF
jgi:hypothetical protein